MTAWPPQPEDWSTEPPLAWASGVLLLALLKKCSLYLTWDSRKTIKVWEPQPSAVHSTNASRFGCKWESCWSSREKESRQCSSPIPNDMMYHSRTDHPMLVLPGACGVLGWGPDKGSHEGQGLPTTPEQCAPRAQSQGVTTDWESERQDQQMLSQEVPLCKGIQYDTRQSERAGQSMPKACVSRVTTVPLCWLGCATALFVPRSSVTLWNYNVKDLSSRQLS